MHDHKGIQCKAKLRLMNTAKNTDCMDSKELTRTLPALSSQDVDMLNISVRLKKWSQHVLVDITRDLQHVWEA